jgi:hypothetical protein
MELVYLRKGYVGHAKPRTMSFRFKSNVARFFVLAVLLSAIACSELPELARLIDNASNDFTAPSYLMGEIARKVTAQVTATVAGSSVEMSLNSSDIPQTSEGFHGSGDLLLLYSILRT